MSDGGAPGGVRAERIESIDFLRGLVMILMALDHTRGMIGTSAIDPMDLEHTTAGLFLTRWLTHFCAPVFVFFAGTAAWLSRSRGRDGAALSKFLLTRGLWLIFLEATLVRFGWAFELRYELIAGQVIWALGCSMIVLALFVRLPVWAAVVAGLPMILFHNLLDGVKPDSFGAWAWLWGILHGPYEFTLVPGTQFLALYPLLPWVGVMLVGYAFGALLTDRERAGTRLIGLGLGITAAFVLLRWMNFYGDPHPWAVQRESLLTVFSFVNCAKYPPSLLFLLMTLGPAIAIVGWLNWTHFQLPAVIVMLGRVPMFFYLVHLPLIHLLAVAGAGSQWKFALGSFYFKHPPPESGYGHGLVGVYVTWLAALALMIPLCQWFARLKQRRRDRWLSYF